MVHKKQAAQELIKEIQYAQSILQTQHFTPFTNSQNSKHLVLECSSQVRIYVNNFQDMLSNYAQDCDQSFLLTQQPLLYMDTHAEFLSGRAGTGFLFLHTTQNFFYLSAFILASQLLSSVFTSFLSWFFNLILSDNRVISALSCSCEKKNRMVSMFREMSKAQRERTREEYSVKYKQWIQAEKGKMGSRESDTNAVQLLDLTFRVVDVSLFIPQLGFHLCMTHTVICFIFIVKIFSGAKKQT